MVLIACRKSSPPSQGPPALFDSPEVFKLGDSKNNANHISDTILKEYYSTGDTISSSTVTMIPKTIPFDSAFPYRESIIVKKVRKDNQTHSSTRLTSIDLEEKYIFSDSLKISHFKIKNNNHNDSTLKTGILLPIQGRTVTSSPPETKKSHQPILKDYASANFHLLDVDQGLASSYVLCLYQDSQQNIWLGTYGQGVTKFDGNFFTYYTKNEGLCDNTVLAILEDRKGNLWFGTQNGGLSCYNGHTMTSYNKENSLLSNDISSLYEDRWGNIWIGTSGGGLSCFINGLESPNSRIIHFTEKEGIPSNDITSITEDDIGNIWVGTFGGGLFFLNPYQTLKEKETGQFNTNLTINKVPKNECLNSDHILTLSKDSKKNLWIGTYGVGVVKCSISDSLSYSKPILKMTCFSVSEGLSHNIVRAIREDRYGSVWVATDDGLSQIRESGISEEAKILIKNFTIDNGLSNNAIYSMIFDNTNNLLLGTQGGGLTIRGAKAFNYFAEKQGLVGNVIFSIHEADDDKLWLGSAASGLYQMENDILYNFQSSDGNIQKIPFTAIQSDRKKNMWFGTYNEGILFSKPLNQENSETATLFNFFNQNHKENNYLKAILEDKKGNLWIATNGAGLYLYSSFSGLNPLDKNQKLIHFSKETGLCNDNVYSIFQDNNENIWIGTMDGLSKLSYKDGKAVITNFYGKKNITEFTILSVSQDVNGNIWIGTRGNGLYCFNGESFVNYAKKDGLSDNIIWSLSNDNKNNLWISTEQGINRINITPEQGTDNYQNKIQQFGKLDGLKGLDFFINSNVLDSDNNMWWGSGKGLTRLNLNHFEPSVVPPVVRLKTIDINAVSYDFRTTAPGKANIQYDSVMPFYNYPVNLKIPYDQNHITFYFTAIDWNASHKIRYSYILEGFNSSWSEPNIEIKADYSNIPYGHYNFKVAAIGESGVWSQPFEYHFTVLPPWWATLWSRVCFGILAVLLILGIVNWRTFKLKKQKLILREKVRHATEDLRNKNIEISKQNKIVKSQKKEIEIQFKEITDSIEYAKRIQSAILSPTRIVKEYLNESFILYIPKDVVAGDFYWMAQKNGKTLFAAADCTGHGVPGAMVSVVCSHALNRSIREYNLEEPGKILDKTREIVIQEFEKSDERVRDGMDIALCSLEDNVLKYAGAYNPLWIIRNNELIITKADKQPIGRYGTNVNYTTHVFNLQKGDTIYVFTDGYVDQFGGEKNKKFMGKRFRKLLLDIQQYDMETQRTIINKTFEEWKGDEEQVDDICVIGVKIE